MGGMERTTERDYVAGLRPVGEVTISGFFMPNTDEVTVNMVTQSVETDADGNTVITAKAASEYDEMILQEMMRRGEDN